MQEKGGYVPEKETEYSPETSKENYFDALGYLEELFTDPVFIEKYLIERTRVYTDAKEKKLKELTGLFNQRCAPLRKELKERRKQDILTDEEFKTEDIALKEKIEQEITEEYSEILSELDHLILDRSVRAKHEVEVLKSELILAKTDKFLNKSLDLWGVSPSAKGDRNIDGEGYHAGIVHYFEYRAHKEKAGRFTEKEPPTIEGFVHFTEHIRQLLLNPDPEKNPNIKESVCIENKDDDLRILILSDNRLFIKAIQRKGEEIKIITANPKFDSKNWEKDVAKEYTDGDPSKQLNALKAGTHILPWEKFRPFAEDKKTNELATKRERILAEAETVRSETRYPEPEVFLARLLEIGKEEEYRGYVMVLNIAKKIKEAGGVAMLVGGSVRDYLFGKTPKDFDIEVYGLSPEEINDIAQKIGKVDEVGMAFGILKVFADGVDIDLSLPRTDSKVGDGHKGFFIKTDPDMSVKEAARRRDFTMNTLATDPLTGAIYDGYGGVEDIKNRRLVVTDEERFADDPLRVMRAMQFAARFGLTVPNDTKAILEDMAIRLPEISANRFLDEWRKLLLKSDKPSVGLELAREVGVLEQIHPSLLFLISDNERLSWIKSITAVDKMSDLVVKHDRQIPKEQLILMLSAFCYPLNMGPTESVRLSEKNTVNFSEDIVRFLDSLKLDNASKAHVLSLTHFINIPRNLKVDLLGDDKFLPGKLRRLARSISPAKLQDLFLLAISLEDTDSDHSYDELALVAAEFKILHNSPEYFIIGKELVEMGFKKGINIGKIMRLIEDIRDEQNLSKEQILLLLQDPQNPDKCIKNLETQLNNPKIIS